MPNVYMRATTASAELCSDTILTRKRPPRRRHRRPKFIRETAGGANGPSAIRLSAARGIDLFLQRIEANRADNHIVTDDIARCPVEAERFCELEVFLQGGLYLRACHVLVEPGHVEPDVLGDGERARLVGLAAAAQKCL